MKHSSSLPPYICTLKTVPWRANRTLTELLGYLNTSSQEPQALMVGGCVRNAVLGHGIQDIDIATSLNPDEVSELLGTKGYKVIPTGVEHGTLTAVKDAQSFEITTLRRDVETDGRRAVVEFSKSWLVDARRRDFTMNTLLADGEGRVYDPLQQGYEDLLQGRVVFVGEPKERIQEDYLRILRFFRFHAVYGKSAPSGEALKACKENAHGLKTLSKERITQEILKIAACEKAAETLELMRGCTLLNMLGMHEYDPKRFQNLVALQANYNQYSLAARLYLIVETKNDKGERGESSILIPNKIKKEMQAIEKAIYATPADLNSAQITAYRHGRDAAIQALILLASNEAQGAEKYDEIIKDVMRWNVPVFPVSGKDLLQKGFKPGPELGAELKRLEEDWVKNGFDTTFLN